MKHFHLAIQIEYLFNTRIQLLSKADLPVRAEIFKTAIYFTSQECSSWITWLQNLKNITANILTQWNMISHLNGLIDIQEELVSVTPIEDVNH